MKRTVAFPVAALVLLPITGAMNRSLLLLLALFGLNAAYAGDVGLPKLGTLDGVGVNIHFTHARPGELEMLAAGGFRFVRMDFSWEGIEHKQGAYDFAAYDHLMADLDRLGLRAYFILDYGHRLYEGGLSPHTDDGRAAFCAFVKATMQHFAGRGIVWEMWNEPNISFWKPKPNADDYAKLAVAVGETIRDVTPKEIFVGPTTSEIDLAFMETCFKAGCLSLWDAVSVHPYRHRPPETVADDYRTMRGLIRHQLIRIEGDPRPDPVILSGEWGYSSSVAGWGTGYDEQRQGQYLPRQWLTNIANEVPISIWYDWHDDGTDAKEAEHNFGTVHHAYREGQEEVYEPKPAYLAAKTLTTVLKGYEFSKALALKDDEHVLLFAKGDQLRLAAWTSADAPRMVTIPASPGRFRATGHTGVEAPEVVADDKGLTVTLTGDVQYLAPIDANRSLRLAVAWERLPLEVTVTAPQPGEPVRHFDQINRREVMGLPWMSVTVVTEFRNPMERAVAAGPDKVVVGPGGNFPVRTVLPIGERAALYPPIVVPLMVDGNIVWSQSTRHLINNPVALEVLCPISTDAGTMLPVLVDNQSGTTFEAVFAVIASGEFGISTLTIQGGQQRVISLPLIKATNGRFSVGIEAKDPKKGNVIRALPPRSYLPLRLAVADWNIYPDGDANVASTQQLAEHQVLVNPGLSVQPTIDLDYHMDKGWKFLRITPKNPIDLGPAKEISMWVLGDGSGNHARLRVVDASGQTFQPDGGRLNFTNWKWLTFAITPHTAHWGGANDGVAKAPLKLDTLFLLDHGDQSQPSQGTVRIAGAMAVE